MPPQNKPGVFKKIQNWLSDSKEESGRPDPRPEFRDDPSSLSEDEVRFARKISESDWQNGQNGRRR